MEAYDEEGKKVWKRNLDIYGRVKTEEALGEKNLIPFRFQGQYEDEETGLKREEDHIQMLFRLKRY